MIDPKQVRERAQQLYADIKKRSKPKLWKSGHKKNRVRLPEVPVPYTSDEFASWLLTTIGCTCFLCPYCNAPLDVLSMTLDHNIPLRPGGNEFPNLVACCADCNTLKGKVTGKGYMLFRELMRELQPADEADILKRLRSGAMGMRLSQQMRAQKGKQQPSLVTSDEPF